VIIIQHFINELFKSTFLLQVTRNGSRRCLSALPFVFALLFLSSYFSR